MFREITGNVEKCGECGCYYEYEDSDIKPITPLASCIICPSCGTKTIFMYKTEMKKIEETKIEEDVYVR